VKSIEQSERETCRVIIFGPDRTDVLLVPNEEGFCLPSVEIPRWQRPAENLTATVARDWGCDGVCLFTPAVILADLCSNQPRYEAMECLHRTEAWAGRGVWIPINSLARDSFRDEADFSALQQSLADLNGYADDHDSPFVKVGWFDELRSWAAEVIRPRGLQLTRSFCQLNASPSFSLIRFETNGPDVWFKAVGEPNLREFPITLELARLFPNYLPELIGNRPEWNGWLSFSAGGSNLSDTREIGSWEAAATSLARLQIASISKVEPILHAGAHDLKVDKLSALVDRFLNVVARLMAEQTKLSPPVLAQHDLNLLGLRIEDSLTLLDELGIPDALGHLDLNPGNIILSPNGGVFVDWAEAYVGHPFFSFQYLLEHFRRTFAADPARETEFVRAYSTEWRRLLPADVIAEALTLAPLAAVFAYAAGTSAWRDQESLRDAKVGGYFRSLARRMNREAIQLIDRRSPCLS
jgi:hypothetical protein